MSGGISAYSPPPPSFRIIPTKDTRNSACFCTQLLRFSSSATTTATARASHDRHPLRSNSILELKHSSCGSASSFRCNSSSTPGGPGGESDSKRVLDAFFLGKALAEAINERIESTVGEFLSTVGRLQAEQQKQVQDFQEEVLEKAKRAKEKAAREAMEAQGLVSKSPTSNITTFSDGATTKAAPLSTEQQSVPPSSNSSTLTANKDENSTDSDPLVGISIDD